MGNRALVIFHEHSRKVYGPVVYLHWHGGMVGEYLSQVRALMGERLDDVDYATARFIGLAHEDNRDALSLGVWEKPRRFSDTKAWLEEFSHGDAGVFLVDAKTWEVRTFGGYGLTDEAAAA
ncbi:MAG: hypothetical protein APF80_11935 [Alphaproteobacteria bacterium BRH_c36]|nr:MAG: hypothetical protein APF80_11935 [Alphaproteobacteria bacterium BRH_c36]